jgi:mycothiol synthase
MIQSESFAWDVSDTSITFHLYTPEDLASSHATTVQFNLEVHGANNMSISDFESETNAPGHKAATDTLLAKDTSGSVVGIGEIWTIGNPPVEPRVWGYVLPEFRGRGIGTALIRWGLERSRALALPVIPQNAKLTAVLGAESRLPDAKALIESFGMEYSHSFLEMEINLADWQPSTESYFPEGFTVRNYAELSDDIMPFVHAHRVTFADHRGFVDTPLEERISRWKYVQETSPWFEPSLWFIVMDGEEPAGAIIGWPDSDTDAEMGYIQIVGVYPNYRRRGLGQSLLQHAFRLYKERGVNKVGLDVDGSSLTGATRLYEKAGMHVVNRRDMYALVLRDGEEIARK